MISSLSWSTRLGKGAVYSMIHGALECGEECGVGLVLWSRKAKAGGSDSGDGLIDVWDDEDGGDGGGGGGG